MPDGFIDKMKGRGLIVKWAPQKEILAHFAVGGFWSHCGWNSTLESISEGIPMLCQPFIVDQGVNARYVAHVWKIGLQLEFFERGEIESVIRRLMVLEEGEQLRVRANDIKELVKKTVEKGGSSLDSLEALEIVPNLHPLRYKDLPFSNMPIEDWKRMGEVFSQQAHPSAIIWNTIKFLEHEALTQIQDRYKVPVFAVGPLHKITPSLPTNFLKKDTSCMAWLDKQAPKSVIYISFGSLVTLDTQVLTEMAWGLALAIPVGHGFIDKMKGRGLIVKWAPQKEILAHFAVGGFWSHCGWNSTLESISEGIPMLCQPFIVDQGVNARYVAHVWKIGLQLEFFERGEIESVIRRLMVLEEGEQLRVRANDIKELVKKTVEKGGSSLDSLEALVDFILTS
ncbi:UDP-glucuronosyl/UDP-glucosyltransferase [Artemisia annua]|uniref:UDP-glucuronosyl/UDP-glucosyltransferase n=1 Tax=Artemisia annua TaxID=35608 RepID=A0A2U1M316_ARTAN|nr:UDP-glucuronosyl/UDP-glucosyltransferase [Artemisia annua]